MTSRKVKYFACSHTPSLGLNTVQDTGSPLCVSSSFQNTFLPLKSFITLCSYLIIDVKPRQQLMTLKPETLPKVLKTRESDKLTVLPHPKKYKTKERRGRIEKEYIFSHRNRSEGIKTSFPWREIMLGASGIKVIPLEGFSFPCSLWDQRLAPSFHFFFSSTKLGEGWGRGVS